MESDSLLKYTLSEKHIQKLLKFICRENSLKQKGLSLAHSLEIANESKNFVNKELLPIFTKHSHLGQLSVGVALYFDYVVLAGVIHSLMFACSIPVIMSNWKGSNYENIVLRASTYNTNEGASHSNHLPSLFNSIKVPMIALICITVLWLILMLIQRLRHVYLCRTIHNEYPTVADFSIVIKNLPISISSDHLRDKLSYVFGKIENIVILENRTTFVTFSNMQSISYILKTRGKCSNNIHIEDFKLKAEAAPDPSDLRYENLKYSSWRSYVFLPLLGLLFAIALSLGTLAVVGAAFLFKEHPNSYSSIVYGLIALTIKKILVKLIKACVHKFGFLKTYSSEKLAIFVQVYIGLMGLTTLQYYVLASESRSSSISFESKLFYAAAAFLVTEPLISLLGPFTLLKKLTLVHFVKKQEKLNELFEAPEFDTGECYTNVYTMQYFASLIGFYFPVVHGIVALYMLARYFVDKYTCLRVSKKCRKLDESLSNSSFGVLMTFALIYIIQGFMSVANDHFRTLLVEALLLSLLMWWIVCFCFHCIAFDPVCSLVKLAPFIKDIPFSAIQKRTVLYNEFQIQC